MKLSDTLKAALAASSLALAACDNASGTRDTVENTHRKTEEIFVVHRTTPEEDERITILQKLEKSKKLYTMLDEGEYTAQYFNKFSQDNESQWKDYELAGRLADVQARLATLVDLIQEKKISQHDVETILRNNILISGVHESQSPIIMVGIQGNVTEFFHNHSPLTVIRKGADVVLQKDGQVLQVSIKHL